MSSRTSTRVVATGARLVAGAIVSAACVAGAVIAVPAAWPTVEHTAQHATITPVAGDTLLSCAGSFLALGRDASQASQLSVAATPQVVRGAAGSASLDAIELGMTGVLDDQAAPGFSAAPEGRKPALVAAAQSLTVTADDLAGFAASACRPPSMESWIVGGAGTTGSSDILLIANPGAVPANVVFTEYGSQGGTHSSELVVPPHTQSTVPLVAGSAGESSPVVKVTSSGAPVRAALQSSLIRILDPVGVDVQDAIAQPLKDFSLLGVRAVVGSSDDDNASTAVRLLSPDADATVTLQPRNAADGSKVGEPKTVKLTAGQVGSVNFSALKPGLYGIDVSATAPVVAAAWQTTGFVKGSDFAWMTPAPTITGETAFAVADGPAPQLHLQNASDQATTVQIAPVSGGKAQSVALKPGGGATIALTGSTTYTLTSPTAVRAAVAYSGIGRLAGYPVWAADAAAAPVTVYQR
ncbi:DUF5719 family protein [Microbacterium azadirachtae]|uniref:DUF5719 family protein n=1 Tax=Microbacterium azadirachtae TaxID=582680 RepID=UPI0021D48D9E|nr:DUF5719 family protein [Microbacterium azadirachtae]UXW84836.1 DUF5719 family protein [Microbacterium azadirachtae]